VLPSSRRVAYLGWVGHGNLGDEAIHEALRAQFEHCRLALLPGRRAVACLDRVTSRPLVGGVVLGGGTLIGWRGYRRRLTEIFSRYDGIAAATFGTGVLDPGFDYGPDAPRLEEELREWVGILSRFRRITVRGPRSARILSERGVPAEVVGDPALLLADPVPATSFTSGLIGLNLGLAKAAWGRDPAVYLNPLTAFWRRMIRRGWHIRLVSVNRTDRALSVEIAERIGRGADVFENCTDVEALLDAIRPCHAFVGMKLHSVVFASSVYVPALMLEYDPKCRDFQALLGREEHTVRVDRLAVADLIERVERIARRRDEEQEALLGRVGAIRDGLVAEAKLVERLFREKSGRGDELSP
jgi:polysaccharide pyruvyl transferase WcaK-like protein